MNSIEPEYIKLQRNLPFELVIHDPVLQYQRTEWFFDVVFSEQDSNTCLYRVKDTKFNKFIAKLFRFKLLNDYIPWK